MTSHSNVRYASSKDVLRALDKDPSSADSQLRERAKERANAATEKWINRTGQPFHPVRVGDPDEPRTWETHDAHDVTSFRPVSLQLDNGPIMPLEPNQGDAIEVRTSRDSWDDVTDSEGREWTLEYRTKRLNVYRRRLNLVPFDDPSQRFVRITYRYGPLGEDVEITDAGLVTSVPSDVTQAVAAKAAMRLVLDDELKRSTSDDGQLTDRSTKRSAFKEEWESTAAEYTGFSTI